MDDQSDMEPHGQNILRIPENFWMGKSLPSSCTGAGMVIATEAGPRSGVSISERKAMLKKL